MNTTITIPEKLIPMLHRMNELLEEDAAILSEEYKELRLEVSNSLLFRALVAVENMEDQE